MRSLVVIVVFSVLGVFALIRQVEACYQLAPSVSIRSRSVAGTVSVDGKPIAAVLSLHKFLGPYAIEIGQADPHPLRKTITGKDGRFDFGEVPAGKYVIFMASPSSELTDVEVVRPKSGENDTIAINFFADLCQSASVISASGEKLKHSTPPNRGNLGCYPLRGWGGHVNWRIQAFHSPSDHWCNGDGAPPNHDAVGTIPFPGW